MSQSTRIYLDNAATSWPKPPEVYDAVDRYQREIGAPAGRGAYAAGQEVERTVADCRRQIALLLGVSDLKRIAFGFNGTDVLNIALHGLVQDGDHVVTSIAEHNSVLRPLRWLRDHRNVSVTYVGCDEQGVISAKTVLEAITPQTRLVALTHASNVTGALQPIQEIAERMQSTSARLLIDAAQSLGHVPIDVKQTPIDLLAASGHKGLLGPLGTGVLYVAPGCEAEMESFRQGGTGTRSELDEHPEEMPDKLEAGNLNVPGLYGLAAGVAYLNKRVIDEIRQHEIERTQLLRERLASLAGVTLYGPPEAELCTGVTSFSINGMEPQEAASLLDSAFQIQVRSGLHCAPRMHEALGTQQLGGTIRASLGPFNSIDDIEALATAVEQISASVNG